MYFDLTIAKFTNNFLKSYVDRSPTISAITLSHLVISYQTSVLEAWKKQIGEKELCSVYLTMKCLSIQNIHNNYVDKA